MNNIINEIEEFEKTFNELNRLLKEYFLIDNKTVEEESIYYIIDKNREIIKELENQNIKY